jgi:signal transduction histidine kinase
MITEVDIAAPDPRIDQLRKLLEINRAFSYTTGIDEVAQFTVERGTDLLGGNAGLLMLLDEGDVLHVRATHRIDDARVARFRSSFDSEITTRLRGLLDVPDDRFIAVPLIVGGRVTGLLAISLTIPATNVDEWLLSGLADQAGVALESARLGGEVRVEMEGRLRASEGATNAKDRALATLAHDIRSPLGAIEGYCGILEDGLYGPMTPAQLQGVQRIRMSGRHLLSLLDNVMDMARLTAGKIGVRREPVRLDRIARDSVDILMPAALAKRQQLRVDFTSDVIVVADEARARQILVNLIGNAVKFTPAEGTISVTVRVTLVEEINQGEIRVTDTGPGIAEDERASIFEPYFRSEGTAKAPGVGLGLAISKALVEQLGGTLAVESELGKGSSFVLRFPLS